jgi:hypothetical protein
MYSLLIIPSSLAKGYDPFYSSSPLASLDRFSRSHGDSGSCNQSEHALQKAHVLYEKCQQKK